MAKTKAILVGSSQDPRLPGGPMEGVPPPVSKTAKKKAKPKKIWKVKKGGKKKG
jgi:hypothetical protein